MDALLISGKPFVVAFEPAAIVEAPEDFRLRAQWFKANRQALPSRCAAIVVIVLDEGRQVELQDDLAKRSRGFGVPYLAFASFVEAAEATPSLVNEEAIKPLHP